MNRYGAVFWLILVLVAGFATFKAKYAIQDLEDELAKVRKQTVAEQQEMRVLTAEWTYLNQPERLAELNKRFLNLVPVAAKQLQQRIEDIPLRTPPAVAPAPESLDQLVAAATDDSATPAVPAPVATPAPEAPAPAAAASPAAVAAALLTPISPAAAAPAPIPAPVKVAATSTPAARPVAHVQLAKASPPSLDALIAKIVEVH